MRESIFVGLFTLLAAHCSLAQSDGSIREYQAYTAANLEWRKLEKTGKKVQGQDVLAAALDEVVAADGSLRGRLLQARKGIVYDSLNLRNRMASSGRLALAMREQERSERMVDAWARSAGADQDYDCLRDAPSPQMSDDLASLIWRMRSARAALLDSQGDSLAALELLERTVEESGELRSKGRMMGDELRRSYNNLGNLLAFLGYWEQAVDVFDRLDRVRAPIGSHGRRSLESGRLNRLFPIAKLRGYTEEIVEQARGIFDRPGSVMTAQDRASYERQIAKFEYRAGMEERARERVSRLLEEKGALSLVDRMFLERLTYVEDGELPSSPANDSDYERMLETYRARGMLRSLPTLYRSYAIYLERAGRIREAIAMQKQAISLSDSYGWALHVPLLLAKLATMHDSLGEHELAAGCWGRIDALLADVAATERGLPESRRFSLAFQRLDWLERNGRAGEARENLANLRESVDRTMLSSRALRTLDNIEISEDARPGSERPQSEPSSHEPAGVVIEPVATQTVIERGGVPAQTQFSLLNPDPAPVAGTLRVSGAPMVLERLPDGDVRLELGEGATSASLAISLSEQERLVIKASSIAKTLSCKLEWIAGGTVISGAEWQVSAEANAGWNVNVQGTTASVARRSRFYAAPLYQEIRWTREAKRRPKNFRVRTSRESWVSYRLPGGKTIAVDGNGDGDFRDAGDSISVGYDSDANLVPDVSYGDGLGVFGLEVFVYPVDATVETTTVDFELLDEDGGWRATSRNQLREARLPKR